MPRERTTAPRKIPLQTSFGNIEATILQAASMGAANSTTVSTPTSGETLIRIEDQMYEQIGKLDALEQTTGLDQYAKDQFTDQSYVIANDVTQARDACGLVIARVLVVVPRSGGSDVALHTESGGRVVPKVWDAASLTDLKAACDALAAVTFGPA